MPVAVRWTEDVAAKRPESTTLQAESDDMGTEKCKEIIEAERVLHGTTRPKLQMKASRFMDLKSKFKFLK